MAPMLESRDCDVLITLSSAGFSAEEERAQGFESELARLAPAVRTIRAAEGMGLDQTTRRIVDATLASVDPALVAPTTPVVAASMAPTRTTEIARPPRLRPKARSSE